MTWKLILVCTTVLVTLSCKGVDKEISATERLDTFYKTSLPENNLIPFLVAGGPEMVPLLLIDVQKTDLEKRRYLIGALGELKDERALEVLTQLALNPKELNYIRCDALDALTKIVNQQELEKIILPDGGNSKMCDQY